MSWIMYDGKLNKFYHFDYKAEANRFYQDYVKKLKTEDYKDGDSIFVAQVKDCSVKREGKIKKGRYF